MATYNNLAILQRWAIHTYRYMDISYRRIINEQTGGTVVSQMTDTPGSYFQDVKWANEQDAMVLDDPSNQATVTPKELKQISQFDVKVAARSTHFQWQRIAFRWMRENPERAARTWARTIAESSFKLRNSAIFSALMACFYRGIGTGKDTEIEKIIDDQSGTTASDANKLDVAKLLEAQGKYGDLYGDIRGIVIHSAPFFTMQARNLTTYNELFMYPGTFTTMTNTGLPMFVTDNPILAFTHNGVKKYRTMFLRSEAAILRDHSDFDMLIDTTGGQKWINTTAQAEQTYSLCIKGMSWKTRSAVHPIFAAAKSPNTSLAHGLGTTANAIDTPGSWERVGTAESAPLVARELPGILLITQ